MGKFGKIGEWPCIHQNFYHLIFLTLKLITVAIMCYSALLFNVLILKISQVYVCEIFCRLVNNCPYLSGHLSKSVPPSKPSNIIVNILIQRMVL